MLQNKKYAGNPTDKNKSSNANSATPYKRKYGFAKFLDEVDPFFFNEGEFEKRQSEHETLAQLFEGTPVRTEAFRKEFIHGSVVSQTKDGYYVNIGRKYDAFVPLAQGEGLTVTQEAEFYVIGGSDKEGIPTLSFTAAKGWRQLEAAQGTDTVFTARVFAEAMKRRTQKPSGYRIEFDNGDIKGIRGFIPNAEVGRNNRSKDLIGKTIEVTVITAEPQEGSEFGNLVLSNKEAQAINDRNAFDSMEEGTIVVGNIMTFIKAAEKDTKYSALVRLQNGLVGMLHRSETVTPQDDLASIYKEGDEVSLAVRTVDHDKQRVGLSLKMAAQMNCLNTIAPNTIVEAKILRKVVYGYFASIVGGAMEGLIHESDLNVIDGRTEAFKTGDTPSVMVLSFNPDGSRLALGRKQLA